jgi:hypothetical protein
MSLKNSSNVLLRVASIVAFIQFAAHTLLLLTYKPAHGPGEVAVVAAMKSLRFDLGGFRPHTYWELYIAYGLFAAFNCLVEAVLFWLLASNPNRSIIALFCLANAGYAILVALYFFPIPLVLDLTIAACLGFALISRNWSRSSA